MRISRRSRDATHLSGTRAVEPAGDDAITHQLVHALLSEPHLDQCGVGRHVGPTLCAERPGAHASWWIELYVENGVITLDGTVPSLAHKKLAGEIAHHVAGARGVVNAINVEST
jgi:osmotically-inducible protein OsmY